MLDYAINFPAAQSPPPPLLCPDPWAKHHVIYNRKTNKFVPARCKRWACYPCARVNILRIGYICMAGNPERFVTLSRAGKTKQEVRLNLQHLLQGLRRQGYKFEYFAVPELHLNGQAHIHLLQKGDYIPYQVLSDLWKIYTAESYGGAGSWHVNIQALNDPEHARRYLLKYLVKNYQENSSKSWEALEAHYKGLNHYRFSRGYLPLKEPGQENDWMLVPTGQLNAVRHEFEELSPYFIQPKLGGRFYV